MIFVVENVGYYGFLIIIGLYVWCVWFDCDGERVRCSEWFSVLCGVGY